MKVLALGLSLACSAVACVGQSAEPLCPRHIEMPDYPAFARVTNLTGQVSLVLTVDADGTVIGVKASTEVNVPKESAILEESAVANIRTWTFAKPLHAPYNQTIVYEYQLGNTKQTSDARVTFDLPNHVTIVSAAAPVETKSELKKRK